MIDQGKLVKRLRESFDLSTAYFTDNKVLEITKGTLSRDIIELKLSLVEVGKEIAEAYKRK